MLDSICSAVCPDIYCHLHTLHRGRERERERGWGGSEEGMQGVPASTLQYTTALPISYHWDETF